MHRRGFLRQISLAATLPLAAGALGWSSVFTRAAAAPATGSSVGLGPSQAEFVSLFADTLIPVTDTPGAVAAGVPAFLTLLFNEWFLPEEQASFLAGIEELGGTAFSRRSANERLELLRTWDAAATAHYSRLRGLVLIGYYTSDVGQNMELQMQYGAGADRAGGPVFGAVPFKI